MQENFEVKPALRGDYPKPGERIITTMYLSEQKNLPITDGLVQGKIFALTADFSYPAVELK